MVQTWWETVSTFLTPISLVVGALTIVSVLVATRYQRLKYKRAEELSQADLRRILESQALDRERIFDYLASFRVTLENFGTSLSSELLEVVNSELSIFTLNFPGNNLEPPSTTNWSCHSVDDKGLSGSPSDRPPAADYITDQRQHWLSKIDYRSNYRVISELAHSLKTPLAHLEADLRLLARGDRSADEIRSLAEDILISIELCKAFLAAYREVSRVSGKSDKWSPQRLRESLMRASHIYARQIGKLIDPAFAIPDSIPGYSNNYLIALLLPLLENAIEASPSGATISMEAKVDHESLVISLTNAIGEPIDDEAMETAGISTKNGHEGIGIATVRDLVTVQDGGELTYKHDSNSFTITVRLPKGETNG